MGGGRKKRVLSEEEAVLWKKVVAQVEEIQPNMDRLAQKTQPKTKVVKSEDQPKIKHFRIGQKNKTAKSTPASKNQHGIEDQKTHVSPNMDRKNFQRLLKGKLEIDATLDLHGLTAEQARTQMMSFVQRCHRADYRLLLMITGKGKQSGYDEFNRPRMGVIKQGVPEWLKSGPLSGMVLQITQAHVKHGGGGAYYVYLRRRR